MATYVIRRVFASLRLLVLLVTIVFFVLRLVPGGPAVAVLGERATPGAIQAFNIRWGLDQPLLRQYVNYVRQLLSLDLGVSYTTNTPVSQMMANALPHSLMLMGLVTVVSVFVGIAIGSLMAIRARRLIDSILRVGVLIGLSIPDFYLGILMILLFSLKLGWLPMRGAGNFSNLSDLGLRLIMPVMALGSASTALIARITRSSMLEVLNQPYIATARAKGLVEWKVIGKHALRNALTPVLTVIGVNMGLSLGNTIIIETVFSRPGIGKLLTGSVMSRDFATIQSTVVVFALCIAFINLLTDIAYGMANPAVRYD